MLDIQYPAVAVGGGEIQRELVVVLVDLVREIWIPVVPVMGYGDTEVARRCSEIDTFRCLVVDDRR